MKSKPIHQVARKRKYYVRMLAKELLDEVTAVLKTRDCPRRLTLPLKPSDNLENLSSQLVQIHQESDDNVLCDKLTTLADKFPNKEAGSKWKQEIEGRIKVEVLDDQVPWSYSFPASQKYSPVLFTAWPVLHTSLDPSSPKPPWADEDFTAMPKSKLSGVKFNQEDELNGKKVDRKSRECKYEIDPETGLPRNPRGRTGMRGRGLLGRFGPNLAADPIVSRWKKTEDGSVKKVNGKPVLECVFIQRRDNNEWAIPGGMVEPGTEVSLTLVKEFREEALNVCHKDQEKAQKMTEELKNNLFTNGSTIYEGYVDDPRNTDNAWMETVAKNFHDEKEITYSFKLEGGDDACHARWQECSSSLNLYASHKDFIETTVKKRGAHW